MCDLDDDGRRTFFRQAGGCLALAMAAVSALRANAPALPIALVTGARTANQVTYPIPSVDGASVDTRTQVILVRHQGRVCALALACPHQGAAVKWRPKDERFQCTKHDSRYDPEGVHTAGRATRNMDRFPIRRDSDAIVVTTDRVFHSDLDAAGWTAAVVTV